jgi:hypothetical protein
MRRHVFHKIVLVLCATSVFFVGPSFPTQSQSDSQQRATIIRSLTSTPLVFTENRGQWDDRALFRADAGGATMWFTAEGTYYQFVRPKDGPAHNIEPGRNKESFLIREQPEMTGFDLRAFEQLVVKAAFVGANPGVHLRGVDEMAHKCNYFLGGDADGWQTDVPNYRAIVYEDVYDGIDLKYYSNGRRMEYDFIVSPGADYRHITVEYEGIESLSVNEGGELVIATRWGVLKELAPLVFQEDSGNKKEISSAYRLESENSFGFDIVGEVDPGLPVVIDPGLFFGTYLGGTGDDQGYAIAVDDDGNAYVTGITYATEFPTQLPVDSWSGMYDAFVTKINHFGSGLAYSTYLGGGGGERGYAIAVDNMGCAYVTGATASTDFPTENAYKPNPPICDGDAWVTKLNACGNKLVFSTYLGGTDVDWGYGIDVDDSYHTYVAGATQSTDFPTKDPYQTDQTAHDVYVTKFSSAGDTLIYSTYLGGSDIDAAWALAVDGSGNACVTGVTVSTDFPTVNAYQTDQGNRDAFVTKLNAAGDGVVFSTYLGGSNYDRGRCIGVDAGGNVYVTGNTQSFDFPTVNPYQTRRGADDAFVTKFNAAGGTPVYSTYLGGSSYDLGYDVEVDGSGQACVAGWTMSINFPIVNHFQTHQDTSDAFVAKLNSAGTDLVYSTYLGGDNADEACGVAVDGAGDAYVTGYTMSTDFPTQTAYQTHQGAKDAFIAKLSDTPVAVDDEQAPTAPERFALRQNVPNPFNPSTTIHYDVPAGGGAVSIRIYDVNGRLVRTLVESVQSAGQKAVTWKGRDNRGASVASGVYFYRMTAPDFVKTRKMVLLR